MKRENGINIVEMIEYLEDIRKKYGDDVMIWHLHDWEEPITEAEYSGEHIFTGTGIPSQEGMVWPKRVELSGT